MPAPAYKPDPLLSQGASEKPFSPAGGRVPALNAGLTSSLARLARMRSYGFSGGKNTMPISQPMALTAGSHGKTS